MVTKVDASKFEYLNQFRWQARRSSNGMYYAIRAAPISPDGKHRTILMHREVLGYTGPLNVDHVNRDPLDNQESNLRIATHSQNKFNQKKRSDSKWPYKGISQPKGKAWWVANIQSHGISHFLGCFKTAEDARDAYVSAAEKLHGEFACSSNSQPEQSTIEQGAARGRGMRKGPVPTPRPPITQPDDPSIRYISLPGEYFAIVDAEDYERINAHLWRAAVNPQWGQVYANRSGYKNRKGFTIWLHKEVLGVGRGVIVDHINGNTLDCRKANLRIATATENSCNTSIRKNNKCGFKGVYEYRPKDWTPTKKWKAQIKYKGLVRGLGYFMTPEEAHEAYKKAADELHGEFANY